MDAAEETAMQPISFPTLVVLQGTIPTYGLEHVLSYLRAVSEISDSVFGGSYEALVAYLKGRLPLTFYVIFIFLPFLLSKEFFDLFSCLFYILIRLKEFNITTNHACDVASANVLETYHIYDDEWVWNSSSSIEMEVSSEEGR